jgi:outer membrane protein assembly factor BamA
MGIGKTLYSIFSINASYTAKSQILFQLKNNVYTKNNKIFFSGDWRYLIFSQPTYGLGTNSPEGGALKYQYDLNGQETSYDSLAQPMNFNFIRFYQTASFQVAENLYAGLGYHLDSYIKIVDHKLDLTAPLYTSHYLYNTANGFNTQQYTMSAINFNVLFDTRDNMINPYKGYLAQINFRVAPKFLGNEKNGEFVSVEWRSFHGLSRRNSRHLISFWALGNFTPAGEFPYLMLPALGYDQRGRSGRGYAQGRFRGPNMIYTEAEYRFPISKCGGIIGGVLFVNATTTDNPSPQSPVKLFNYIAPGYGFGFRMMVDKRSRTNLQLDFAFGNNSTGIYLGAAETF